MNLIDLAHDLFARVLDQATRPLRLRFAGQQGQLFQDTLVPQRVDIVSAVCDGLTAHLTCLTTRADLPLQELLGLPIEVQIVTDTGQFQRVCVIVTDVRQGQSDGALTTVQLTGRDILAVMEGRRSNRVFLDKSAPDIARIVLDGWRSRHPAVAHAFDYVLLDLDSHAYPPRAFTFQAHQSDADFLRSLLRRHGIAWFFRPGQDGDNATPAQQLVLFDNARNLPENSAGPIRYHRRSGTEARDTIDLLAPAHTLVSGAVVRSSYDHETAQVDVARDATSLDQGQRGNDLAAALQDARIELPHAGDTWEDHQRLTGLAMKRHEFRAQCLHGAGGVRAQAVGEWNRLDGYPLLETRPSEEREYITIRLQLRADNNLPKELNERAQGLLAANAASIAGWVDAEKDLRPYRGDDGSDKGSEHRYTNRFIAVPRTLPIVPAWNPETDLPRMPLMTALVVGPEDQPVWCDELGRVKVRILGLDPAEHDHASGAGTNGNQGRDDARDSAWVRVNFLWAGEGFGVLFPLRAGMEVTLGFDQGDPSRPTITGSRYHAGNRPPRFDHLGNLPANRALSGIVTREFNGTRQQQLRFNDTQADISTQLATDHAATQLNLGSLGTPMSEGKTEPRGDGAELRTDAQLALRGGRGVLITSSARPGASGHQLERAELIGLSQALQAIVEQLGTLAETHQATGTDATKLRQLVEHLQAWEQGASGSAPVVAVSAAAGAGIVSQDNLLLGAQTQVDIASAGHTQVSAGQRLLLRCSELFSAFAHGTMKLIAQGKVEVQSHADNIELSARRIVLTASDEVVIQAPKIRYVAQGAQVDLGNGQITQQSQGAHVIEASSFAQTGPGGGSPPGVSMPSTTVTTDEKYVLRLRGAGTPQPNRRYAITLDDGATVQGRSDAQGRTRLSQNGAMRIADIALLDD